MCRVQLCFLCWFSLVPSFTVVAGIYSGPIDTGHAIDPAIASSDSRIVAWASRIEPLLTQFAPRGSTSISETGFNSLGDLSASEIASGISPGFLTVGFDRRISNGDGHDFAVFENGFLLGSDPFLFAELAFVEVSSNGADFARFASIATNSEADLDTRFGRSFSSLDTTNVYNLAGKHRGGFGTPFDLAELVSNPKVVGGLVDLEQIQFVRLIDIPGNGAFADSLGNPIYDAWLTTGSGGFDFRLGEGLSVGAINVAPVPEPSGLAIFALGSVGLLLIQTRRRRSGTCSASPSVER